jgi:hypothetical protein
MQNALSFKPNYTCHRRDVEGADAAVALLPAAMKRATFSAKGWSNIQGVVKANAGVTITLEPLELVKYIDSNGDEQSDFITRGSDIGPISPNGVFSLDTPGGGLWLLRAKAVAGDDPVISVHIAGGNREPEGSI